MHPRRAEEPSALDRQLHRWVRNGLISEEAAGAIRSFEHGDGARRRAPAVAPSRSVPFLVEVLGYLGTALAGAAGAVFLARIWNDLALAGRLVIPAVGSVVFLGAGSFVARSEDPVAQRLAGFLWLLGAAATGWFTATLAADAADASERVTTLAVGCSVALVGAGLLAYRQWPVSQLVLAVGLVIALAGAFADAELGFATPATSRSSA